MWGYGMHDGAWGTMFFWILLFLLFIFLFVGLVIYFIRKTSFSEGRNPSSTSATDLLKERYAGGEINTEEYRERLRELEGHDTDK